MIYGIDGVDIPQELLDAQEKDELVVFAGAGVSVGHPSGLPSFPQLVDLIAAGAAPRREGEPLDQYLGRLEDDGVQIQPLARQFLTKPDSQPRQLHRDLMALFANWSAPRIVTTNFDPHFTACAASQFGVPGDVYSAPALPVGTDFTGIVHLHGSLARRRDHLVLSDKDFGRAYVTEAWAARFLVEMFKAYTVLFVGYSHSDPIMRYLAGGLPPNTSRFALTRTRDVANWRSFGIVPIEYPERDDPHRHAALDAAVSGWATAAGRGLLEHAELLKEIVGKAPPRDRAVQDYVESAFRDAGRLQFVVDNATSVEWLQWADDRGLLEAVFTQEGEANRETRLLAGWIADHYALEHPVAALVIARKHNLAMCRPLWTLLAARLGSSNPPPTSSVLAAWVVALLQAAPIRWSREPLGYVLRACKRVDDLPAALLLMDELLRPELLRGDLRRAHINGGIELVGDSYDIAQGWATSLLPHVAIVVEQVEDVVTAHISHAHRLLLAVGLATRDWDPISQARAKIAAHAGDLPENPVDPLIDISRALLEWLLRERYAASQRLINRWANADATLLRRLALHGIASDPQCDPDRTLELLRSRYWLYSLPLKPEVFAVMARAYPRASPQARTLLIQESMTATVLTPPEGELAEEEATRRQGIADYERYNLAVWLVRVAPECALAAEHLAALQREHPGYGPREHPNLSSTMVVMQHGPGLSPVTADEMLAADPVSVAELLTSFSPASWSFDTPTRAGLLWTLGEAATRSFEWGWQLAAALASDGRTPSDVWELLVGTWQNAPAQEATDAKLLAFLAAHPAVERAAPVAVASLLAGRLDGIAADALPTAEELIDRLSKAAAELPDDEDVPGGDGLWLTAAISHPGGRVAQLWLTALSRRRQEQGDAWTGIPSQYRQWLEGAASNDGHWGAMARVVVAGQLYFLYSIDPDWSRSILLPLFDWDSDPVRAEQAWHGFAITGQLSESLLADLMPQLRECFRHLDGALEPVSRDLSNKLVGVALDSSVHALESGWLDEFIRDGGAAARRSWAAGIGRELGSLDESKAKRAWHRWMAQYWERRLMGVPRRLLPAEGAEMMDWIYGLAPVLPEVAQKLDRTPMEFVPHRRVFTRLAESELAIEQSTAVATVLARFLSLRERPFDECDPVEALVPLLTSSGAPAAILHNICESMVRLGCPHGLELAKQIPRAP